MAGGDDFRADPSGHIEKLIELDEVVAQRAGDRRAASQILIYKGLDYLIFEALLKVDDVVGDAEMLGDIAGVVDVIERTATAGGPTLGS